MSPGAAGSTSNADAEATSDKKSNKKNQSNASGSATQTGSKGSTGSSGVDRGTAPRTGGEDVATIGKSIIIKGDLSGDEDLIIDGKVEGRVQLPNNEITVGPDGRITADIEAKSIIVVGKTAGNLNASERVEVQATGTVEGDINAPRLQIDKGATVNGSISMTKSPASAKAQDTSAAATPIGDQARKSA